MPLLKKLGSLPQELLSRREQAKINSHPDQLVIEGNGSLLLFQPHHTDHYDGALWGSCAKLVEHKTDMWVSEGKHVVFFLEEASKRNLAQHRKLNRIARSGEVHIDKLQQELGLEYALNGDGTAGYHYLWSSLLLDLKQRYNVKGAQPVVWSLFEQMPRIQSIGAKTMEELDPRRNPLEISIKRFAQVTAFGMTRDIALAAHIINELRKDPNLAIVVVRGTEHLGLAVGLETMAEMAYHDFIGVFGNIDNDRETTAMIDLTSIVSRPVVWSRNFWKEIFKRKPYLLQLPDRFHQGMDMQDTANMIRALLNEEPWVSFTTRAFTEISQLADAPYLAHITLTQRGQ